MNSRGARGGRGGAAAEAVSARGARGGSRGRGSFQPVSEAPAYATHQRTATTQRPAASELSHPVAARGRSRFLSRMGVVEGDEQAGSPPPPPPPSVAGPAGWGVAEVACWLSELGFKQYAEAFKSHHVTGAVLPLLSKDVLKTDLGIASLGHRLLVVQGVRTLFPDSPPSSGDGAAATRLADVEGQANKAASLVFAGQAEVQRLTAEVGTLKRALSAATGSVAELSRTAAKPPSNAPLSAETQARLNKALKQSEAAQASCVLLKEDLASHRGEMQKVTSTLAKGLKESLSGGAAGAAGAAGAGGGPLPRETSAPREPSAGDARRAALGVPAAPAAPTRVERADKADKAERTGAVASTAAAKKNARGASKPEPNTEVSKPEPKRPESKPTKPANQAALGAAASAGSAAAGDATQPTKRAEGKGRGKGGRGEPTEGGRGGRAAPSAAASKPNAPPPAAKRAAAPTAVARHGAGAGGATPRPLLEAKLSVSSRNEVHLSIELL